MHIAFEVDDRFSDRSRSFFLDHHRFAFDDVFVANFSSDFRENRNRVRVPLAENLILFNFFVVFDSKHGTLRNLVVLQLTTAWVKNRNLTISIQYNGVTRVVGHVTHTCDFDFTGLATGLFVLFGNRVGGTTDVERTHGKLSTGLTDTLSRDDSNGHTSFDHIAGRHVHSITATTNTQRSITSHRATNLDLLQAHVFDLLGDLGRDHLAFFNDHFVGHRVNDVLTGNTTVDRCGKPDFDLLTTINYTFGNTLGRTTIFHRDHNVLRDVGKLSSQVTRVSGFERGVGQTFSSTVSRREVLKNR